MFTDDDVLMTRWARWHRRVMAMPIDALYRWVLVASSLMMLVFTASAVVAGLWSAGAALVRFVAGGL